MPKSVRWYKSTLSTCAHSDQMVRTSSILIPNIGAKLSSLVGAEKQKWEGNIESIFMSWSIFDNTYLSHTNGTQIKLVCGTWLEPVEINPRIPDSIDAVEQTNLIKQGLLFARNNSSRINPFKKSQP